MNNKYIIAFNKYWHLDEKLHGYVDDYNFMNKYTSKFEYIKDVISECDEKYEVENISNENNIYGFKIVNDFDRNRFDAYAHEKNYLQF